MRATRTDVKDLNAENWLYNAITPSVVMPDDPRGQVCDAGSNLEKAARVAKKTIADFEREARLPLPRTLAAIQDALEAVGVEFTNSDAPGVRLIGNNKKKGKR
jgi:hypothetical protein